MSSQDNRFNENSIVVDIYDNVYYIVKIENDKYYLGQVYLSSPREYYNVISCDDAQFVLLDVRTTIAQRIYVMDKLAVATLQKQYNEAIHTQSTIDHRIAQIKSAIQGTNYQIKEQFLGEYWLDKAGALESKLKFYRGELKEYLKVKYNK